MENNPMPSSPIELIGSLSSSIQEVKEIYRLIKPIKNTLLSSKKKKNIAELEEKIEYTEAQIQELRLSVTGLSKLVTSYAYLISEVRIATASSDKFSELIELQPDILNYYKSFFVHKMRDECTRVASGIPKLPKSKNIESAEKFGNLEMILRNLRDLMNKLIDNDYLNDQEVKNISKQISSQYCDMNATLSQLLEEILAGLGSV